MGPAIGMEFGASLSTLVPSPEILGPHPSPKIGEAAGVKRRCPVCQPLLVS